MRYGVLSFGYRKIKSLQASAWQVTHLTLWGKPIESNNFNGDIMCDVIEEEKSDLEDTRDSKVELNKPKYFSHNKCTHWEDRIYNYFSSKNNGGSEPL